MIALLHETMTALVWAAFVGAVVAVVWLGLGGAERCCAWLCRRFSDTGPYPDEHPEREP